MHDRKGLQLAIILVLVFLIMTACTQKDEPAWVTFPGATIVRDMAFDSDGDIWAVSELGVFETNIQDQSFKQHTTEDGLLTYQARLSLYRFENCP